MFVIRKSLNPRQFKGVKNKPCPYGAQKKAWMNLDLFEQCSHKSDHKFQR